MAPNEGNIPTPDQQGSGEAARQERLERRGNIETSWFNTGIGRWVRNTVAGLGIALGGAQLTGCCGTCESGYEYVAGDKVTATLDKTAVQHGINWHHKADACDHFLSGETAPLASGVSRQTRVSGTSVCELQGKTFLKGKKARKAGTDKNGHAYEAGDFLSKGYLLGDGLTVDKRGFVVDDQGDRVIDQAAMTCTESYLDPAYVGSNKTKSYRTPKLVCFSEASIPAVGVPDVADATDDEYIRTNDPHEQTDEDAANNASLWAACTMASEGGMGGRKTGQVVGEFWGAEEATTKFIKNGGPRRYAVTYPVDKYDKDGNPINTVTTLAPFRVDCGGQLLPKVPSEPPSGYTEPGYQPVDYEQDLSELPEEDEDDDKGKKKKKKKKDDKGYGEQAWDWVVKNWDEFWADDEEEPEEAEDTKKDEKKTEEKK